MIDKMIKYIINQPFVFNDNKTKNQQDMDKDEKTMEIKIDIPEGYEIDEEKSTFGCIRLKKKETILPATWEEFCATHIVGTNEAWVGSNSCIFVASKNQRHPLHDRNFLPSKELAEAMLALCQLIQLRDCYNQGWTPSWNGNEPAYVLYYFSDEIEADMNYRPQRILAFKTSELRDRFLENFRDLIEVAKPLL